MLFNPFEEQFNFPPFPIQLGNGQGIKRKVIGQEMVNLSVCKVFVTRRSSAGYFLAE